VNIYAQFSDEDKSIDGTALSSSTTGSPPWTRFIVPLLSSFAHRGPNGNHTCLVFEAMGCSVSDLINKRPMNLCFHDPSSPDPYIYCLKPHFAKDALRQILAGLVVFYCRGMIHGDLHAGNVLFPLQVSQASLSGESALFVPQDTHNEVLAQKVRRLDGRRLHENAPRYLIAQESLVPYSALEDNPVKTKLIDIQGCAPEMGLQEGTPTCLQSPELALEGIATEYQDIWAFGFAIFEMLTGSRIFSIDTFYGRRDDERDELMVRFSETLGPLTPAMKTKWEHYSWFFDDNGRRNETRPGDRMTFSEEDEEENKGEEGEGKDAGEEVDGEGEDGDEEEGYESDTDSNPESESLDMAAIEASITAFRAAPATEAAAVPRRPRPISHRLEDVFDCFKPSAMSAQEGDAIKSLLRRIFQYEPEKRPRAAELLKDPWFAAPGDVVAEPDGQPLAPREQGKAKRKRSSEKSPKGGSS
jgi:serine/threonine protein kinase